MYKIKKKTKENKTKMIWQTFFYLQRLAWPFQQSLQEDNCPDHLVHA